MKKGGKKEQTSASSTRETIIEKAIEITNEVGMVDFRIDSLAGRLGLSPGNITYHFSKKEELVQTLWEQCYREFARVDIFLTRIVDVKQFFLFLKGILETIYRYRGVIMFRGGDLKLLRQDKTNGYSFMELMDKKLNLLIQELEHNGYLNDKTTRKDSLVLKRITISLLRHWINMEMIHNGRPDEKEIRESINRNVMLILRLYHRSFTAKGLEQFSELESRTEENRIDIA